MSHACALLEETAPLVAWALVPWNFEAAHTSQNQSIANNGLKTLVEQDMLKSDVSNLSPEAATLLS